MDKVDENDIHDLSLKNPVVHAALGAYRNGSLTYLEAMMTAVKILVEQNESLFKTTAGALAISVQIPPATELGQGLFSAQKKEIEQIVQYCLLNDPARTQR